MRLRYKLCIVSAMLALTGVSAFSADLAILRNGFAIRHERRETRDDETRLFLTGAPGNYVDIPADQIVRFEKVDELPVPPVSSPVRTPTLEELVTAASSRNSIDPDLVISMIRAESGFDPNAVSPKGAQGLMQLMPRTAARLGVENPMDPAANVEGGTRYMRELLALYNNDLVKALGAYNAGPARIQQYHGVPPYQETLTYIARIISDLNRRKLAQARLLRNDPAKLEAELNSKTALPTLHSSSTVHGTSNSHM